MDENSDFDIGLPNRQDYHKITARIHQSFRIYCLAKGIRRSEELAEGLERALSEEQFNALIEDRPVSLNGLQYDRIAYVVDINLRDVLAARAPDFFLEATSRALRPLVIS